YAARPGSTRCADHRCDADRRGRHRDRAASRAAPQPCRPGGCRTGRDQHRGRCAGPGPVRRPDGTAGRRHRRRSTTGVAAAMLLLWGSLSPAAALTEAETAELVALLDTAENIPGSVAVPGARIVAEGARILQGEPACT